MCLVLLALLVATPVAAQDGSEPVSEQTAYRMSLLGTIVPIVAGAGILVAQGGGSDDRTAPALLITSGLIVGPFLGYGAAGMGGRGLRGIGVRAGLSLATIMASIAICGMDCTNGQTKYDTANLVAIGGVGLVAVAAAYDVSRLRHNMRRGVAIGPMYVPRERGVGVRVSLAF